jgi:small subunit ribosomal protein S17
MGKRKEFVGEVISDKMRKTRIVRVMRLTRHKKYAKMIKRYNKFKAHDEKNVSHSGDTVKITETRPLSKEKHFRIVEVIKKAQTPFLDTEAI